MEVATVSDFDRLMGDSLKAIRDDHVKQIEAEIPAARRQIASKVRRRSFTFVIGGVAVAAAATAVALFIAQSVPKIDRAEPIPPSGPPAVVARIDVPGVGAMAPGLGSLWVAHSDGLVEIDPTTSDIGIESPVDGVEHMALNSEAMYTVNTLDRTISRLPFGTDEAATSTNVDGDPTLVAASDESVWFVVHGDQGSSAQILRADPGMGLEESSPPLKDRVVADMTYAEDALWLSTGATDSNGFEVRRLSSDGEHTWELSGSEGSAADIVVGEGAVWVLRQATRGGGNTISRIDLSTNEVTERSVEFEDSIESIAVGEGYLWATTAPLGMNMPDDARATLHRIDPTTLEPAGDPIEVAEPGSKLEIGYGFVWVGDPNNQQIVQVDPSTEGSPEPAPSATPEPDETKDEGPPAAECQSFLPFLTSASEAELTLGLGSGGQDGVPLAQQSPRALVHYADGEGGYIDVIAGETVFSPVDEEPIEVLGTNGTLHQIEDGYAVSFGMGGCEFQLLAYGAGEAGVRAFVKTLVLRGHSETSYDAFALWPEPRPEDAYLSCLLVADGYQEFRRDPQATALEFARDQMGWSDAAIANGKGFDVKAEGYEGFYVVRKGLAEPPEVALLTQEVAPDCWSVSSVNSPVAPDEPTSLSVTKRGARLNVAFDLEVRGLDKSAATIRMPVEDGSVSMTADEFRSKGQQIEGVFRSLKNGPGAFLILIEDAAGQVIGAIGQALPSGDFTAG